MESRTAPIIAENQLLILNPGRKAATIFNTAPFTTKVKNPNVIMFKGSVRKIKIGQINVLAKPKAMAAKNAEKIPLTSKPFTIFDVSKKC
jgi:hypothetical protein